MFARGAGLRWRRFGREPGQLVAQSGRDGRDGAGPAFQRRGAEPDEVRGEPDLVAFEHDPADLAHGYRGAVPREYQAWLRSSKIRSDSIAEVGRHPPGQRGSWAWS